MSASPCSPSSSPCTSERSSGRRRRREALSSASSGSLRSGARGADRCGGVDAADGCGTVEDARGVWRAPSTHAAGEGVREMSRAGRADGLVRRGGLCAKALPPASRLDGDSGRTGPSTPTSASGNCSSASDCCCRPHPSAAFSERHSSTISSGFVWLRSGVPIAHPPNQGSCPGSHGGRYLCSCAGQGSQACLPK
eukprot:scaffold8100_cov117-Isochrysis_galbana.AAC.15